MATKAVKVYISYARMDRVLVDELKKYLQPLQSKGLVELWSDLEVAPGGDWNAAIDQHLNEADIILLMVSPDLLNSDYCYSREMQRAIERHLKGQARVIPIILRPVHWQDAPFSRLQVLPIGGQPVTRRMNIDEALGDIADSLRKIIQASFISDDSSDHISLAQDSDEDEITRLPTSAPQSPLKRRRQRQSLPLVQQPTPMPSSPVGPSIQTTQPIPSSPPTQQPQPPVWKNFRESVFYPLLVAILTLALTLGVQWFLGPQDESTIIQLMDQEVQIATTHTGSLANIYDAQATVIDAGCQTPGQGVVWSGLAQITDRYNHLPQFTSLQHASPQISWEPNNRWATKAYVSATTIGGTASGPIHGNERWTFAKINGRWLITSFTYNFCQP